MTWRVNVVHVRPGRLTSPARRRPSPQVRKEAEKKYPDDADDADRRRATFIKANPYKGAGACAFKATAQVSRSTGVVALSDTSVLTHSATCPIAGGKVKASMLKSDPCFQAAAEAHGNRANVKVLASEAAKAGASSATLWRTQRGMRKIADAAYELKFNELPVLLVDFVEKNPGSHATLVVDEEGVFRYCFLAIGPVHAAIVVAGRPVFSTDFGHLKGDAAGLNATGMAQLGCGRLIALWTAIFADTNEDIDMWETVANLIKDAGMDDVYRDAVHFRDRHAGATRFEVILNVKWGM